jgi:hypothetical protein
MGVVLDALDAELHLGFFPGLEERMFSAANCCTSLAVAQGELENHVDGPIPRTAPPMTLGSSSTAITTDALVRLNGHLDNLRGSKIRAPETDDLARMD